MIEPTPAEDTPALVTIDEAMRIAHVARRTIHHWLQMGKIEYVRTAGGRVRIVAETLFKPSQP